MLKLVFFWQDSDYHTTVNGFGERQPQMNVWWVSKLESTTNIKWSMTMKFKKLNNVKGLLIISSLLEILRTHFFLQIMKTTPYQQF